VKKEIWGKSITPEKKEKGRRVGKKEEKKEKN
jgi:hypothetical protein